MAVLLLVVLAAISVSIVTAVNNTSDVMELDDGSEDIQADDTGIDEIAADEKDDKKIAVEDTDKISDDRPQAEGPVIIKKVWVDNNNALGKRPSSVTVKVTVRGDTDVVTLRNPEWTTPVMEPIGDITVTEEPVDGYTTKVTKNANVIIITNTLKDMPKNDTDNNDTNKTVPKKNTPDKKTPNQNPKPKKTVKVTKKTTTEKAPSKAAAKNQTKKAKDKHNTGNPVLLGALAVSLAGLAISFRRKE